MIRACLAAVCLCLTVQTYAWGQASVQTTDVTRRTTPAASENKFHGSLAELSTYVGSGSFYVSGYRNPYTALALYARPSYDLGTRFKLTVNARLFITTELTAPDDENGRRVYVYDPWVWLSAQNLHTFERSKLRISGTLRTVWPVSPESRYANMLFAAGAGPSLNRKFEFGQSADPAAQWSLSVSWGFIFSKYLHTSHFRGDGPGDTTGCRAPSSLPASGASAGGAPAASDSDRCGGPANTNFALQQAFVANLARGKWSVGATLLVINTFKYAFPADVYTADAAATLGRSDQTWGIMTLGYQVRPQIGVAIGLSSLQPALDSRYRYPRFPFFDFSGANAHNYTNVFVSVNGTL
jgi:hypothetical protein